MAPAVMMIAAATTTEKYGIGFMCCLRKVPISGIRQSVSRENGNHHPAYGNGHCIDNPYRTISALLSTNRCQDDFRVLASRGSR